MDLRAEFLIVLDATGHHHASRSGKAVDGINEVRARTVARVGEFVESVEEEDRTPVFHFTGKRYGIQFEDSREPCVEACFICRPIRDPADERQGLIGILQSARHCFPARAISVVVFPA